MGGVNLLWLGWGQFWVLEHHGRSWKQAWQVQRLLFFRKQGLDLFSCLNHFWAEIWSWYMIFDWMNMNCMRFCLHNLYYKLVLLLYQSFFLNALGEFSLLWPLTRTLIEWIIELWYKKKWNNIIKELFFFVCLLFIFLCDNRIYYFYIWELTVILVLVLGTGNWMIGIVLS